MIDLQAIRRRVEEAESLDCMLELDIKHLIEEVEYLRERYDHTRTMAWVACASKERTT